MKIFTYRGCKSGMKGKGTHVTFIVLVCFYVVLILNHIKENIKMKIQALSLNKKLQLHINFKIIT